MVTTTSPQRVTARFCEIFERDVAVYPVINGTAANALGARDSGAAAWRDPLPCGSAHRGRRMRRAGILHARRQARADRRARRQADARRRSSMRSATSRKALCITRSPRPSASRSRPNSAPSTRRPRSRRSRRWRTRDGHEAAHGRRALRQRARRARLHAGGADLESRRRCPVVRRDQERRAGGRSGHLLRSQRRRATSNIAARSQVICCRRCGSCRSSSKPI